MKKSILTFTDFTEVAATNLVVDPTDLVSCTEVCPSLIVLVIAFPVAVLSGLPAFSAVALSF